MTDPQPLHVDPDRLPPSPPVANPLAGGLNVMVSIPETLEIRMVDASALGDYEVWAFISSVLSSAAVGFLVAYLQEDETKMPLLANSVLFMILFGVSLVMVIHKRYKLRAKSRSISLRAMEVVGSGGSTHT